MIDRFVRSYLRVVSRTVRAEVGVDGISPENEKICKKLVAAQKQSPNLAYFALKRWCERVGIPFRTTIKGFMQVCGSGSGRIRNVLPGSGSGIIIPDPDPESRKKNSDPDPE